MEFTAEFQAKAKKLFEDYPEKVHALLPLLHMAQQECGCLNAEVMQSVASMVEVPLTHVEGVVTFYTQFSREKRGKNYIGVCTNLSCWLNKAEHLLEDLEKNLQIRHGQSTMDGNFFLEEVECLGACGYAPVVLWNEEYVLHANKEQIMERINQLKSSNTENKQDESQ